MEAITSQVLCLAVLQLLMCPVIVYLLKRTLGQRLDAMDEKRELARKEAESARTDSRLWRQAMESGMKSLLRAELLHEHNKWTRRGYCPFESKQYLERLHDAYKGVGGNSIGDHLYEETIDLPTSAPMNGD